MPQHHTPSHLSARPKKLGRWLLCAGVCLVAASCLVLYVERRHFIHPQVTIDRNIYPVMGVDISNHNGAIDFGRVSRDGISFVIIKASEGQQYRDPAFASYYRDARRAGLKVGAYHFFRKKTDGHRQAANFMTAIGGRRLDLPVVVDVEDWNNDRFVTDDVALSRLNDMVTSLKKNGRQVMIYTNGNGYKKYVSQINDHDYLWLCSFSSPELLPHYSHHLQQFSHWGTVDGIKGDVDMNVFNGSREKWNKWIETTGR